MSAKVPNGIPQRKWSDVGGPPPAAPSRRLRLFRVLLALLALAAVLAAVLLFLDFGQGPRLVSVAVTESSDHRLPVNALAGPDGAALREVLPRSHGRADSLQLNQVRSELRGLGPSADDVIVHLSALSRCDPDGVFLMPGDADANDPNTWLPLDEVVRAMHDCGARHKLLILDVQRGGLGPRLGLIADAVGPPLFDALRKAVERDPNLWVLCPCSPGETSLALDELPQSVFVYYVVLGLQGRADGCNAGRRIDQRVTLDELASFVTARVERRARLDRGAAQVPVLFGDRERAAQFFLSHARKPAESPEPDPEPPTVPPYPQWLLDGWKLRDAWADDGTLSLVPSLVGQLEATLLRAEEQLRGRNVKPELAADLQRKSEIERKVAEARRSVPNSDRRHSFARAIAAREKPPGPKEVEAVLSLGRESGRLKGMPPAMLEAFKAKVEQAREPYKDRPFALAWLAFETALADTNLDRERLRFYVNEWLRPDTSATEYAETLVLQRLADLPPNPRNGDWPKDAVDLALEVERAAERAAACQVPAGDGVRCEPRVLPYVRGPLDEADRRRRQVWALLGDPKNWPSSRTELRALAGEYAAVQRLAVAVSEAERTYEEALSRLPAYADWLLASSKPTPRDESDWSQAVQASVTLGELLARPTHPAGQSQVEPVVQELKDRAKTVRDKLATLHRNLVSHRVKPSGGQATLDPGLVLEADALLRTSALKAADRADLWKTARDIAIRLGDQTSKMDRDDFQLSRRLDEPAPRPRPAEEESRVRMQRARCLAELLRLGGRTGLASLEQAVKNPPQDDAGWHALAAQLREASGPEFARELRQLLARPETQREADRLVRMASPADSTALRPLADRGTEPALELRRREARAMWAWLAGRCQAEAAGPGATEAFRDFYSRAAADYLHSAE